MFNGWNETRMHHVWRTNFEKSKLPSASKDMQLKFYFQRALIARNRLKRQAMAKPVLSEQEVNTIKERVTYFGQHCVTNFVTNLVILKIGHFKEKSKSSFTCFMAHELWSIINLWSISKYVTYIYSDTKCLPGKDNNFFSSECFRSDVWKLIEQKINSIFVFYLQISRYAHL